ncbi:GNAT family N-acetyltransferase [Planctobacterium marinum]|uniref:GNAT family N-acetyltransferase n=1 Tax=Planctobacterium marinum TaxID=1631968 RepID=UPI001E61F938|nr:GNAT family N-acetyltransferase [Planctobacterium marinum]MCC2606595.1 GNAT family N-acetyltransferase [Planctobacterium marinum]
MTFNLIEVDYNNPHQASDLVAMLNHYAQDPMGGGEPLSEFVQQNLAKSLAQTPGAFSFIIYIEGKPAAMCNCFTGFSTFACKPLINIHDFVVHSDFRGQGLSKHLLSAVAEKAKKDGCCKVTLEVLSNNKAAIQAYNKFGFKLYQLDEAAGTAQFMELKLV